MTQPDPVAPVTPGPQQPPQGPAKTFTQDELNAFLAEDRRKTQARYGDYDALTEKAKQFDAIEAQNATELDKAIKKADADARADVTGKTNQRLVRAEIKATAAALGFHNPGVAATQLAEKFGSVKVSDTGDVDEAAVKALVEQLAKDEPYLVKTDNGRPQPLPGQGHHQQAPNAGRDQALEQARKRGFAKAD